MSFDVTLFHELNSLAGQETWLDTLIIFLADGFDVVLILFTIFLLLVLYDPKPGVPYFSREEMTQRAKGFGAVVFSTLISWGIVVSLKSLFESPRPFLTLPDAHTLFIYGGFDAFPSGHAALFAALATALFIYNRKIGIVYGFFALVIGSARVIAGVHFPFDVLAGYALGGLIAWTIYYVYKYLDDHVTVEVEL